MKPRRAIFLALVAIFVLLSCYVSRGMSRQAAELVPQFSDGTGQYATINGSDGAGGIIDPVNLWNDYTNRTAVVAKLHPGDKVKILQRDGNGVLVETSAGSRGWLSAQFLR